MEKKDKRKKILKVSGLVALFLLVFGLSYALFTVTLNGTKKVKLKTGKLELQLLDANNNPIYITDQNSESSYAIELDNQVPVDDETGLGAEGFTFKLKNTGNVKAKYTIYLDDVALESNETRIDDQYVKYALTKNGTESTPALLSTTVTNNERELDKGTIDVDNTTNTYTLKIWIDEEATNAAMDKVFSATLRVVGTQYVQTGPFESGTMAAELYKKGVVAEYNTTDKRIPNGFNAENEEEGLIKYTDEFGTETYAYRGIDVDNYVTFAETTWRILRIQEDGTVKLIAEEALNYENTDYDYGISTSPYGSDVAYRMVQYNKTDIGDDDAIYSTSNVKSYVEAWYNDTMTSYDGKIATNVYCSDRSEDKSSQTYNAYSFMFSKIYGALNKADWEQYGVTFADEDMPTMRWRPSISCTLGEEITGKVALITAEEFILAGGGFAPDKTYIYHYLRKEFAYWTMSPWGLASTAAYAHSVDRYGACGNAGTTDAFGVRPVITLKPSTSIASGDGSAQTPYVIS